MNNDRILKKSIFGGFRRSDVLDYIEKLQNENVSLADELREKSAQYAELESANEQNSDVSDELEALRNEMEELQKTCDALRNENEELKKANSEITAKANKNEASYEELGHEMQALNEKYSALEEDYGKLSNDKSNALIQDAMRYSDTLVSGARKTADKALNDAHSAIGTVTEDVFSANEQIRTAQQMVEQAMSTVRTNVDNLVDTLSKCSSQLSTGE